MARRKRGGRSRGGSNIVYATKVDGVPMRVPASAFSSAILQSTQLMLANLATALPDWAAGFKVTSIFVAGEVDGGDYQVSVGNSGTQYAITNNLKITKIPIPNEDHAGWWGPNPPSGSNGTTNIIAAYSSDNDGNRVFIPLGKYLKSVQVLVTDYVVG